MARFIWEILPLETPCVNKYLSRLSNLGKLDFKDETNWPVTDVFRDENGYYIIAEVSGIASENLEVYIAEGRLVIIGEKPFPALNHSRIFMTMERDFGEFFRIIDLPEYVNRKNIEIDFKDGILKIRFKWEKK